MDTKFINSFFDFQKTGNVWLDLNPLTKLNICFALALTAVVVHDYRYGVPLIILACILAAVAGKFKEFFSTFWKISLTLAVFLILIRQIGTRPGNVTPLINVFGWQWYLEAFIDALDIITFIMGFSGWMLLYFVTTPMRDLMYVLEKRGMSHENSFIMLSAMQNIIDLRKASVMILESQKARGIETEGNVLVRLKAFFPTLGPLILGAITSTEEKAIAMDARAFSVKRKHTFLREIAPMVSAEKVLIALIWLYFVATIIYRVYPVISGLFK